VLAYTLSRITQSQQAVIERDFAPVDAYGADAVPDWRYHLTVPCLLWWQRSTGARSSNRTYVGPNRTVPVMDGGLVMSLDVDVTERDRITCIQNPQGTVVVEGIIEITVILPQTDHLEVMIVRPHLGA
jgi:hypothetical protein